jgi:hypothetical protein
MALVSQPMALRRSALGAWGASADLSDPAFVAAIDNISKAIQGKDPAKATALITQSLLVYGPSIVDAGQELFSIQNDSLAALEAKEVQYQYKVSVTSGSEQAKWKAKLAAVRRRIASLEMLQKSAFDSLEELDGSDLDRVPKQSLIPGWAVMVMVGGGLFLGGALLLKRRA